MIRGFDALPISVALHTILVIISFRHKGLERLYLSNDARYLSPALAPRLRRILAALDTASDIFELRRFPGWRLHELKGEFDGYWSISVSANWRVVFRFDAGDASEVTLVDYH
jgi:proteic killer suppression protein